MYKQLVIIGAGGVGREILAVLKKYPLQDYALIGFVDDGVEPGTIINGLKVLGGLSWIKENSTDLGAVIAIGNPSVRKKITEALSDVSLSFPQVIHPNVSIHDEQTVKIGKGSYIADGCILTTDIHIANFCFLNTACSLQHDTVIGDYSVLMPGVRITGGASIGSGVYITANCAITTKCLIEDDSVITTSIIS
ncbi:PglD-related sugar-binding protein [Flavobacterium hauense]